MVYDENAFQTFLIIFLFTASYFMTGRRTSSEEIITVIIKTEI